MEGPGVIFEVEDDFVRLDDLLVVVHDPGVVITDGNPEPLYPLPHVHHTVGRRQDVDRGNDRAAAKMNEVSSLCATASFYLERCHEGKPSWT